MDSTLRPLYVLRPPAHFVHQDFVDFLRAQDVFMRNIYHAYGHVVCMDHIVSITAKDRTLFAEHERKHRETERVFNLGQAFVLSRPVLRGMLRAVQWISPPVYPWRVVASEAAGVQWVQAQLDARHVPLPELAGTVNSRDRRTPRP